MSTLMQTVRSSLLLSPEVTRLTSVRRFNCMFSQGQPAEAMFIIEEGLVKQTRTNQGGDRIILAMCGPGDIVGEEALGGAASTYAADAEVLTPRDPVSDSARNAKPDGPSGRRVRQPAHRLPPQAPPNAGREGGAAVPS